MHIVPMISSRSWRYIANGTQIVHHEQTTLTASKGLILQTDCEVPHIGCLIPQTGLWQMQPLIIGESQVSLNRITILTNNVESNKMIVKIELKIRLSNS